MGKNVCHLPIFTQVVVNYENAELGPRERAMLDFAMAVCRCDTITEQHFQSLEEVGFDREDAWDIAAIAAFFAMSNRLAHLTDMRPNLEFYNMGRVPRDKSKDKAAEDSKWNTDHVNSQDYKRSKIMRLYVSHSN